jgi:MSHA biogenesis protein MshQ
MRDARDRQREPGRHEAPDVSAGAAAHVACAEIAAIGRFVPARFALSVTSITHRSGLSCSPASTFSYLGETFRVGLTLTAQNASGATTTNYTGSFAKLDPTQASAWRLAGRDGSTLFTTGSSRLSLGSATGSWSAGVTSGATLTASALRSTSPDGPFSAAFGVAPVDSDGVALAAFDMASAQGGSNDRATVGTVSLRFGRLRLSNAIGAADRVLALPATLQYWNTSHWATNTLDSCTSVSANAVSFGNLRRTLTTSDTAVTGALTFSAGVGTLRLAAPGSGHSGTVDVALSLGTATTDTSCLQPWTPGAGDAATTGANLAYLRGAWCGSTWGQDPSARASFGLQRTQDHTIYRRENY